MKELSETIDIQTRADSKPGSENQVELSAVIPVSERPDDLREIYAKYSEQLSASGKSFEFIFVLDGPNAAALEQLTSLKRDHPSIQLLALNRWVGEATALAVGLDRARGSTILVLPPYFQVEPSEIRRLMETLGEDTDLVVAWRHPRTDSIFNRCQSWVFHRITRGLTGTRFHDVSCGLRIMKRKVAEEVQLYGDLHRFFPLLAYQRGFRVAELKVRQSPLDAKRRMYAPGVYLRRMLDTLTLFFLFKFTKKPLRFFGLVGSVLFGSGSLVTGYLGFYRLLGFGPIAERPLLILGVLLMVLGIQLFSIGLLGEIIIFTHARGVKDFEVREIIEK